MGWLITIGKQSVFRTPGGGASYGPYEVVTFYSKDHPETLMIEWFKEYEKWVRKETNKGVEFVLLNTLQVRSNFFKEGDWEMAILASCSG